MGEEEESRLGSTSALRWRRSQGWVAPLPSGGGEGVKGGWHLCPMVEEEESRLGSTSALRWRRRSQGLVAPLPSGGGEGVKAW